jgi:hypothetical protein
MEMVFPSRSPPTRAPQLRSTAGTFCVTGMARGTCLPMSTRSSCASAVVQAGAPWMPCLLCLLGPCRSCWVVTIRKIAMMVHPWIQPGPSRGDANLVSMLSCCKLGVTGSGTTKCSGSQVGALVEYVGDARPAKKASLPTGNVAQELLGGRHGTCQESFWLSSANKALSQAPCFPAQVSPLT